ncbi:hypothetical protein [Achromobacter spanius]|uniref:hypothetical protein n=1 Tax=Achromobacter spanius TaxID=217203 RepID=UPI0037FDB5DC
MTTDTHRDSGQADLPSNSATDPQGDLQAGQPDAWDTAEGQRDGDPEGQLPPEAEHYSGHHGQEEDRDGGDADPPFDDEEDAAEKAKRRKRWDWIFRIGSVAVVGIVGVVGYVLILKPSAPSSTSAPVLNTRTQLPTPVRPPVDPAAAVAAPTRDSSLDHGVTERPQVTALQHVPESTYRNDRMREMELDDGEFEEGRHYVDPAADRREPIAEVPPAGLREASPGVPGIAATPSTRDLGSKVDLVATNVVELNRQMEVLQSRLSAMEGSQSAILSKLDQVADKIPAKAQPAAAVAKAPARAAEPKKARAASESSDSKRAVSGGPAKTGKLAGLWVKGAYPTTGGETQIAWVMNEHNQLEATVRVGAVVRGARVTGFDGMKVITTAGTIQPR